LENLKGRDHLGDLGIDGDIIKTDLGEVECEDMDWINLA
jgi:hypothetical protein